MEQFRRLPGPRTVVHEPYRHRHAIDWSRSRQRGEDGFYRRAITGCRLSCIVGASLGVQYPLMNRKRWFLTVILVAIFAAVPAILRRALRAVHDQILGVGYKDRRCARRDGLAGLRIHFIDKCGILICCRAALAGCLLRQSLIQFLQ